jgi:putative FmdB family regulatory protein
VEDDVPTYQYACTACGHQLEAVQSFADDPLTACPACEGRLRKMFSSVGIVFKGSGFYRTDSRSGSGGAAAEPAKAGDSGESTGSNGAKTEGSAPAPAPAQKTESKAAASTPAA